MRLVHLARASTERAIGKGGLRGTKATVATAPTTNIVLPRAVYVLGRNAGVREQRLVALETLERFADHPDADVQATVRRVALVLQPDFEESGTARRRLDTTHT